MRPKLKPCVLWIQFGEVSAGQCFTYSVDRKCHFAFNTLFLGVLVAVDVYSTAACCGFWKPLSVHPPTAHSGLNIVVSSNYFLLHTEYVLKYVLHEL